MARLEVAAFFQLLAQLTGGVIATRQQCHGVGKGMIGSPASASVRGDLRPGRRTASNSPRPRCRSGPAANGATHLGKSF